MIVGDWFWLTVVLVLTGLVTLLAVVEIQSSARGRVERRFRCPVDRLPVVATFDSEYFEPVYRDVLECSHYPGVRPPPCDRRCLELGKEGLHEPPPPAAGLIA